LNVVKTKMQERRGFVDEDDLNNVLDEIENEGGDVDVFHDNFLID